MIKRDIIEKRLTEEEIKSLVSAGILKEDGAFYMTKREVEEKERKEAEEMSEENKWHTLYMKKCNECYHLNRAIDALVEIIKQLKSKNFIS